MWKLKNDTNELRQNRLKNIENKLMVALKQERRDKLEFEWIKYTHYYMKSR